LSIANHPRIEISDEVGGLIVRQDFGPPMAVKAPWG
jgi:hypothetical protein